MEFGVFIKDEELQGWKDRPEAREMDGDEEDEEDFDPSRTAVAAMIMPRGERQFVGASSSEKRSKRMILRQMIQT